MLYFRVFALFLTTPISIGSPSQITSHSGIFNLTPSRDGDYSGCHHCLVSSMGVKQIHLLQANSAFRLYWIESPSNDLGAFISFCNNLWNCVLSDHLEKTHRPNFSVKIYKAITSSHDFGDLHLLANLMHEEMLKESDGSITSLKDRKHDVSSFISKGSSEIPIFFWNDYSNRDAILLERLDRKDRVVSNMSLTAVSNSKMRNDDHASTTYSEAVKSSMRCMFTRFKPQEAVCRECLAMHSKWFVVRSFHLRHNSNERSGEVSVFLSSYLSSDIVTNCQKRFCPDIISLDLLYCRRIHDIFLIKHQLEEAENIMELREVQQVLENIAYKRMARRHLLKQKFSAATIAAESIDILHGEEIVCIKVRTMPQNRWRCISCIIKDMKGYRLMITSSLYISLVFSNSINLKSPCYSCRVVEVLQLDDCRQDIANHLMSIEVYSKPAHLDMLNELDKSCLVLYHIKSETKRCFFCIKLYLAMEDQVILIRRSPSLLDTSKCKSKPTPGALRELFSKCVQKDKCIRIQNVPYHFCAAHQKYTNTRSSERTHTNIFLQNHIPVGFWPPLASEISRSMNIFTPEKSLMPHAGPARESEIWPALSSIALVEFEYAANKAYDCLECLVEHTKVYFFYRSELVPKGYVWMLPAASSILSQCLGKHCSCLFNAEKGMQTRRPVGLRQVTNEDIKSSIGIFDDISYKLTEKDIFRD